MARLSHDERKALLLRVAEIGSELEELPRNSLPRAQRTSKLGLLAAELLELGNKLREDLIEPPAAHS
jgi:hypothetical protein